MIAVDSCESSLCECRSQYVVSAMYGWGFFLARIFLSTLIVNKFTEIKIHCSQ